jgi:CheY-like chemotaxis protein
VRLPMIPAGGAVDRGATPADRSERAGRALSILLVEDHGDTAEMMAGVLELRGHHVLRAGDVAAALQMAARGRFDLLISDLGLPDGSGLDLMRQLRVRGHMFPGIALSGYGQERDLEQSRAAGFQVHLVKPVDAEHLLKVVDKVVGT